MLEVSKFRFAPAKVRLRYFPDLLGHITYKFNFVAGKTGLV